MAEVKTGESVQEQEQVALTLQNRANDFVVGNNDDYVAAGEFSDEIDKFMKSVDEILGSIKDKAHKTWKETCDQYNKAMNPAKAAKKKLKQLRAGWEDAERKRIEEEQRKKDEELRKQAEEQRDKEAEALMEQGHFDAAEQVMDSEAPIPTQAAKVESTLPANAKKSGARKVWSFEIYDASLIPRQYMVPDKQAIGAVVRAQKDNTAIPGIKVKWDWA